MTQPQQQQLESLIARLESVAQRLEQHLASAQPSVAAAPASAPSTANMSASDAASSDPAVKAYDTLLAGPLANYLTLSAKIGDLVAKQSEGVKAAFEGYKPVIALARRAKKPSSEFTQSLLKPISAHLSQIVELREKNRPSPLFQHLSVVSEGIPALGWPFAEPTPAPHIGEMRDAAQFYTNRILKEYKDKDKTHVEWANSFTALLTELQAYVKQHHTTGLAWNSAGGDAKSLAGDLQGASKAAGGAPPPPPPGPPPPPMMLDSAPSGGDKPDMSSVFGALSKGSSVTAGLKKVDKSQMTHKNPDLRASSVVKAADAKTASTDGLALGKPAVAAKKPPRLALDGHRWTVEHFENDQTVVVTDVELKHVVYIYGCTNSTIQIQGKVNAVSLDNCRKCAVVVAGVVSSVDIVNCKSVQAQVLGKCPTAVIDKTDGLNLFLSRECLDIEILTAKSSELNISIPPAKDGDDYIERPVAEQFRTIVVDGKLVTNAVEHKG